MVEFLLFVLFCQQPNNNKKRVDIPPFYAKKRTLPVLFLLSGGFRVLALRLCSIELLSLFSLL